MISYLKCIDRAFVRKKNKRPFVKGEYRRLDSMMFIHAIENHVLNYGMLYLRVYQEKKKREL